LYSSMELFSRKMHSVLPSPWITRRLSVIDHTHKVGKLKQDVYLTALYNTV
jgi:hypothetical protein